MWSFGILLWEIYSFGRVPYPRIVSTKFTSLFATENVCPSLLWQIKTITQSLLKRLHKLNSENCTVLVLDSEYVSLL
jgi:hypothetical protein